MALRIPSLCLAALLAAACAAQDGGSLRPGASTEGEVRASMGTPAGEYLRGDGGRTLAYPRGPLGTQTFMADLASDGKVLAVRQVLTDEVFATIVPGMTRDQILQMIGPPGETMEFPRLRHVAWDYRFMDTWGYIAIFSVTFDERGIVVSKITRRIEGRGRP